MRLSYWALLCKLGAAIYFQRLAAQGTYVSQDAIEDLLNREVSTTDKCIISVLASHQATNQLSRYGARTMFVSIKGGAQMRIRNKKNKNRRRFVAPFSQALNICTCEGPFTTTQNSKHVVLRVVNMFYRNGIFIVGAAVLLMFLRNKDCY